MLRRLADLFLAYICLNSILLLEIKIKYICVIFRRNAFVKIHIVYKRKMYTEVKSKLFEILNSWQACSEFLEGFTKIRRATINFVVSVCPHGITWLPLHGLSQNLIFHNFFEDLSKKYKFY